MRRAVTGTPGAALLICTHVSLLPRLPCTNPASGCMSLQPELADSNPAPRYCNLDPGAQPDDAPVGDTPGLPEHSGTESTIGLTWIGISRLCSLRVGLVCSTWIFVASAKREKRATRRGQINRVCPALIAPGSSGTRHFVECGTFPGPIRLAGRMEKLAIAYGAVFLAPENALFSRQEDGLAGTRFQPAIRRTSARSSGLSTSTAASPSRAATA